MTYSNRQLIFMNIGVGTQKNICAVTFECHGSNIARDKARYIHKISYYGRYMVDVTILVRVLWPGGPQRIAVKEAELLQRDGFTVNLVFIRETSRKVEGMVNVPHKVVFGIESNRRLLQKLLLMLTRHYNNGRGADATVDLDLIGIYEFTKSDTKVVLYFDQFTSLFSILRKLRGPFKKVVFVHETAFRESSPLKKIIERIALVSSDYILTNSYFNKEVLNSKGYKNVELVYPGIQLMPNLPSFDEKSNICIVVTVFEPWRKPEILIDIAEHLKNTKIVMAGQWADLEYKRKIENEIAKRNLVNRVQITGIVEESVLHELYQNSKVALRLGYDEHGPGMGSLEAIGFGLPLVVNTGIGITELLKNYGYDLIFEEIIPEEIAQTIDKLTCEKKNLGKIS